MRTPMKWWRSVRRRKAGIYLVRTDRHGRPGRENGYVGRSNNWEIRRRQHLGQDARHSAKPWTDLRPVWHVLHLPWWASWRWIQAPLEAAAIILLAPRYNVLLNKANPRRVPPHLQRLQRTQRDTGAVRGGGLALVPLALTSFGVACILLGLFMTIVGWGR